MTVEYLKDSNKPALISFAIVNVVVFWGIFVSGADVSTIPDILRSISIKDSLIALIGPLVTLVLDGLLSADAKARVIYWRWHHPLPGSKAFSEHLLRERRANPEPLVHRWGPLPKTPSDQNRLWYRIYKDFESDVRVREAHRVWLLSRDLTGYAVVFLPCLGISTLIIDMPGSVTAGYLAALLAQYLLFMVVARNHGDRLVRTVLAIASYSATPPASQ